MNNSGGSCSTELSEYELLSVIGEGGMGRVFKARHRELNKLFAVKVVHPELVANDLSRKRFKMEAKAASELTHANLVAVYGHGETVTGSPYLVMDLIDGQSLEGLIQQQGFLDVPRALEIFIQISDALSHAHYKGVVHRDLKPSNVLITNNEDGTELVKVFDFGIAKLFDSATLADCETKTAEVFGSPAYMSPEQCLGINLDDRSDIYSLGCVMYEALTGKPAFAGSNPIQTIVRHLNDEPPAMMIGGGSLSKTPQWLVSVVMNCLHKDPALRYQSMDELGADLRRVRDGLPPVKKSSIKPRRLKFTLGSPGSKVAAIIALVGILALVGSVGVGYFGQPTTASLVSPQIAFATYVEIKDKHGRSLFHTVTTGGIVAAVGRAVQMDKDLSGADFSHQILKHLNIQNVRLTNCDFEDCRFEDCALSNAQLQGSNFSHAQMASCRFLNCNFTGCNLTSVKNGQMFLATLNASGDTAYGANDFTGSNFTNALLKFVTLPRNIFKNCTFVKAQLPLADLSTCELGSSNFTQADLSQANLSQAIAPSTIFTGANLTQANISEIYVPNSIGLNLEQAKGAIEDQ